MQFFSNKETVVLGVGNLIHSDDGVGIHALRRLEGDDRVPSGVSLIDGGTLGLELLSSVYECRRLILLDAVDIGEEPGTVVRLENNEIRGLKTGKSVHQLAVADLLNTLTLVSDIEREIILIGVQPATTDWGTELSESVAAAVREVVEQVLAQLRKWILFSEARAA